MAWREDKDLMFLGKLHNEDLELLFNILTRDPKDGELRFTEELTTSEEYKMYGKNYHMYWKLIGAELQTYGANTIATMIRGGKGVLYREILMDVLDKLKIKYNKNDDIHNLEEKLLMNFLEKGLEGMSENERKKFLNQLNIETDGLKLFSTKNVMTVLRMAIRRGGFSSYKLAVIIVNQVSKALFKRGLSFAANATLTKSMSIFAGPIGLMLMGTWTAVDIASPAFRVTLPATVTVASLRLISEEEGYEKKGKNFITDTSFFIKLGVALFILFTIYILIK